MSLQAAAQEPDGADAGQSVQELDKVTVTAQKFGIGQARAAFEVGKEEIEQRPMGADISQSLARVPGVQVSTGDARGGSFSFEMYMRGLTDEQIGLTLDGIPTGDSRFNGGSPPARFIESSNISRIEVSQSSGEIGAPSRFALGGFINFMTDDPATEFGGTTEFGIGQYGFRRAFARLDTGESQSGWSAYLTASRQESDNWAGPDSRSSERDHFELKVLKTFYSGSRISARVSYNDQRDNDYNIVTKGEFENNPNTDRATDAISGIPAIDVDYGGALGGERKDWLAYVNGDFLLGENVTLKVNPYFQSLKGESYRYQDRSRILSGGDPRAVLGYNANGGAIRPSLTTLRDSNAYGGPADMRVTPRDRDRYGVTAEVVLDDIIQGHSFRLGGWYEDSKSSERRNFHPLSNPATSVAYDRGLLNYVEYERHANLDTTMFYLQDRMRFLDERLKVDLGATYYDVGYEAWSPLEYSSRLRFNQTSGLNAKLGTAYELSDGLELFGGYAQNFSGIPEDAFLGSTAIINPGTLKALESENVDLGLRYAKDDYAFSVQLYQVKLKNGVGIVPRATADEIEPDEIVRGNVATEAVNTAGQRNRGVELTGFADWGALDLYASYAYQDAKHDDPPVGSEARKRLAAIGIIGGARVRDIPRHSVFTQLGWEPGEHLRFDLNASYVGKRVGGHIIHPTTFEEVAIENLDSHVVVGLGARYAIRREGWPETDIVLNVDNLFDKDYLGSVSGATATQPEFGLLSGTGIYTLDRYFIGSPRTWTLSLRLRF
ncbi:TonB-dependent receptor [Pseudoxanthomonas putridarboris]|uniref:TonB-dependent receptor n=1 Tax=Pseudoxanthomonas putridarboris TaxID=752605 RepID=A0ABU9IYT7_9GAMM